ncbi:DUF6143 family protein [Anaerosalibacter sp. Marseille-P3206]|uniref:DUF6143 family protein n=1 Tax=Anaerosalibacter sp. Marseille-P3206 TaxID=1871005 RepID=UPI000BE9786C|nr:DUF6143 family protein [Anaerosalibacter sp. Marseille-P3206]
MDNNLNSSVYCNDVSNQISSSKTNYCNRPCIYFPPCSLPNPSIYKPSIEYVVDVPINLAKSLEGKYYVGYADELSFGKGTSAWARLFNPPNSRVNLHVTVWTVSDVSESTFRAQIWFNTEPPGTPKESTLVTTSNMAFCPIPIPKVKLQYATNVTGEPIDGIKAFVRRGQPETTIVDDEQGKFIFPPGGSFLIFLSNPESPELSTNGRIAFGWWEEPICNK